MSLLDEEKEKKKKKNEDELTQTRLANVLLRYNGRDLLNTFGDDKALDGGRRRVSIENATIQHAAIDNYHVHPPHQGMAALWHNVFSVPGALTIVASAYGASMVIRARRAPGVHK